MLALFISWTLHLTLVNCNCKFYLAPSKYIPGGRGVVAGEVFDINDVIASGPGMLVNFAKTHTWQLQNYVFATNEPALSMMIFGAAMLLNHYDPELTKLAWIGQAPHYTSQA